MHDVSFGLMRSHEHRKYPCTSIVDDKLPPSRCVLFNMMIVNHFSLYNFNVQLIHWKQLSPCMVNLRPYLITGNGMRL